MEAKTQLQFDAVVQMRSTAGSIFWVGGNDIEEEGVWVWNSNGEAIDMSRFWLDGHKNRVMTF